MNIQFDSSAFQKAAEALKNKANEADSKLKALVKQTGRNVKERAQAKIASSKSGVDYNGHTASAPGEAPAIKSGEGYNSIKVVANDAYTVNVEANSILKMLEIGTMTIAPRPWLVPSMEEESVEFKKSLREILKEVSK